jgi:hypothetical protein
MIAPNRRTREQVVSTRDEVNDQITAVYDLLKRERMGMNHKKAAALALKLLPSYVVSEVIERGFSQPEQYLGRIYYIWAAAYWLLGNKREAQRWYREAYRYYTSCDEREMAEGFSDGQLMSS